MTDTNTEKAPMRAGDVRIRAGSLDPRHGELSQLSPEHGGNLIFEMGDGTIVLQFSPNGEVRVRGEIVASNDAIFSGLLEWLAHARIIRGDEECLLNG